MPAEKVQTLVAAETFVTTVGGYEYTFVKGDTRVASDHPAARTHPQFFSPADEGLLAVEQATKIPGEKRSRKK